ncbi:hypothetical protein [Rothia sp. P100]|nr:hypothetical protein [Rothia sp. P100]
MPTVLPGAGNFLAWTVGDVLMPMPSSTMGLQAITLAEDFMPPA